MRRPRVAAALALVVMAVVAAASASAATQGRHIQLGVEGDPARFQTMTGQQSSVRLIIIGWNQGSTAHYFSSLLSTMLDVPMLGIGIPNGSGLTPASIAHGEGDAFLVALNQAAVAWAKPIYIRPLAEMNGWWNSYSAYNENGSRRGAAYSTAMFRKAFARIYLILHGSPSANAKLARLGLPPVQGTLPLTPAPDVQVIWNPQGYGSPDVPGNSAAAYYPGNAFVDVVGDDVYDIRYKAEWASADALYRAHPGKPFAIPEWGLWGIDDPPFVQQMAAFVRTHRRLVLASYFNTTPGSTWDLGTKPRSRAVYRSVIPRLG
jgi:hypothetical protein